MIRGINYYSLPDGTGYGDAAFGYIEALAQGDIPVKWTPVVPTMLGLTPWSGLPVASRPNLENGSRRREFLLRLQNNDIDYDCVILHVVPELFPKLRESGKKNIGYTVWETDAIPEHWPRNIMQLDRVMVPCSFNRRLFTFPGGPGVSVVPHIATNICASADEPAMRGFRSRLGVGDGACVFYSINSWAPRKAIWDTIHTYLLTFSAEDAVCLLFKTEKMGYDYADRGHARLRPTREMIAEMVAPYPDPPQLVVIDDTLDAHDMALLHQVGDCYFSLTHAEGWGLGAFDAASAGNPVVITGWGGQLDYLPPAFSYLVDFRLEPVTEYFNWESYTANQNWARADVEHAMHLLRHVFDHRGEAKHKGGALKDHIRSNFSQQQVIEQFTRAIDGGNT